MIRNDYTICGDITYLHITRRNGDKFDVLIDTEDLKLLDENNYKVHVSWDNHSRLHYAEINIRYTDENGERKGSTIMLHGLVMNKILDKNNYIKVDHIDNKNKLDNRKSNLRITSQQNNSQHRKSKNSNNKSGYRNVSWNKKENRWTVQLQIEGKNTVLKRFKEDQLEEAGRFAEEMRKKYYGDFAGES